MNKKNIFWSAIALAIIWIVMSIFTRNAADMASASSFTAAALLMNFIGFEEGEIK